MTEQKKGWGQTVVGWFVVREDDAALDALGADAPPVIGGSLVDAADARRRGVPLTPPPAMSTPPPPLDPAMQVFQKEPPPATKGEVDFAKVFEAADIDADEQARVAKSLDLVKSLPEGTDPAVKKQIVEASLKAF